MTKPYIDHQEWHIEQLRDLERAKIYLEVSLEEFDKDGDRDALMFALRKLAIAQGGMSKLAERTSLNRQSLYKALSAKGNPRMDTFFTILSGLGYRMRVEPIVNPA